MAMPMVNGKEDDEEVEEEDKELKDEELVDFEVSDYECECDEFPVEKEEDEVAIDHRERRSSWDIRAEEGRSSENLDGHGDSMKIAISEHEKMEAPSLQERNGMEAFHISDDEHKEGSEEGEERLNGRRQASMVSEDKRRGEKGEMMSGKPELEDGELDETAMPHSYENDTEDGSCNTIHGPERKKRKAIATVERHVSSESKRKCKKEGDDTGAEFPQLYTSGTSERMMENLTGISNSGGRAGNTRMVGLGQGNFAPGIMGPGRPFRLPHGFSPFGGIGRPNVHLQEILAQENLLRAHALHLAQETLANVMRHPLNPTIGSGVMNPFLGFDNLRPRAHIPKYFPPSPLPPPLPDMVLGRMEDVMRGQRPIHKIGRSGLNSKSEGEAEFSDIGRQFGLPPESMLHRHRKKDQIPGCNIRNSMWERDGGLLNNAIHEGRGPPGVPLSPNFRHFNSDEVEFYHPALSSSLPDGNIVHNKIYDVRWKIERERMLKNGFPFTWKSNCDTPMGNFLESGKEIKRKVNEPNTVALKEKSRPSSVAARIGRPIQTKVVQNEDVNTSLNSASGNNVVKLHQPIRKSRILTVSGMPDDISISTVVETFEKLGKIIDFKKNEKGDTFTISYASDAEAVTAKRSLHRSYLSGKQITVDYVHQ